VPASRQTLDQWFDAQGVRPLIVGEFQDRALLNVFEAGGSWNLRLAGCRRGGSPQVLSSGPNWEIGFGEGELQCDLGGAED